MAAKIGTLFFDMRASVAKFARDMRSVGKRLDAMGRRAAQAGKALQTMAAGAIAGFAFMAKRTLDTGDKIAKLSQQTGISARTLLELRHASDLVGSSFETVGTGVFAFTKRMGELRAGTGTLNSFLEKTNLALRDQLRAAGSTEQALEILLNAMANTSNEMDRGALSAAAFSRSAGIELANLTAPGIEALDAMRAEARALGTDMGGDVLRNMEAAKDEMARFSRVTENLRFVAVGAFVEGFVPAMKTLTEAMRAPGFRDAMRDFGQFVGSTLTFMAENASTIITVLKALGAIFVGAKVGAGLGEILGGKKGRRGGAGVGIGAGALAAFIISIVNNAPDAVAAMRTLEEGGIKLESALEGAAAGGKALTESAQGVVDGLKTENKELTLLNRAWGENALAVENAEIAIEATRRAEQAGVAVGSQAEEQITRLVIANHELRKAIEARREALEKANEETAEEAEDLKDVGRELGFTFSSAFEDAVVEGAKFRDILKGIFKDIVRILTRILITEPFANAIAALAGQFLGSFDFGGGTLPATTDPTQQGGGPSAQNVRIAPSQAPSGAAAAVAASRTPGAGGGLQVNFNTIDRNNSDVRQEVEQNDPGSLNVNTFIDKSQAKSIGAGGASFRAFREAFGLQGARQEIS